MEACEPMPIPGFQAFLLPVLALAADGEIHSATEAIDTIATQFGITTAERELPLPSRRGLLFYNRVHWALTHLRHAKLLDSTGRAKFRITERGQGVLRQRPTQIDAKFLKQFDEYREFVGGPTRTPSMDRDGDPAAPAAVQDEDALAVTPTENPADAPSATPSQNESDEIVEDDGGNRKEVRLHSRIEYLLLRLGSSMGLQLWIDQNDRNLVVEGTRLGDIPGVIDGSLPQFRQDLAYAVRRIDVLWLRDDEVTAAFEVESTTAVYSGLLRMSDLLALQPNINISLFIVAEERRRKDVIREIGRPTFKKALKKPLAQSCRYISFEKLEERASPILTMGLGGALRPDEFLDNIAEIVDSA